MDKICQNCKHFRRHYIKAGRRYQELEEGHGVYPRLKQRERRTRACDHFRERGSQAKDA